MNENNEKSNHGAFKPEMYEQLSEETKAIKIKIMVNNRGSQSYSFLPGYLLFPNTKHHLPSFKKTERRSSLLSTVA